MKISIKNKFGQMLMRISGLKICIIDDEEIYFNEELIDIAKDNGFSNIERYYTIDHKLFRDLHKYPRDIVILDIQGVVEDPSIAKDGLHVASSLVDNTSSYVVITSAHQFHLTNRVTSVDYVIEDRLLTAVDFLEVLTTIVDEYLAKKTSFYKKILFKAGFGLVKQGLA